MQVLFRFFSDRFVFLSDHFRAAVRAGDFTRAVSFMGEERLKNRTINYSARKYSNRIMEKYYFIRTEYQEKCYSDRNYSNRIIILVEKIRAE